MDQLPRFDYNPSFHSHHVHVHDAFAYLPIEHQLALDAYPTTLPDLYPAPAPFFDAPPPLRPSPIASTSAYTFPDPFQDYNNPSPIADPETGQPVFCCPHCQKAYTGKHARSIWRRHLQDKHHIPLSAQPRRTRWDSGTSLFGFVLFFSLIDDYQTDANRPKTDAERRERTLESKRRWARKNRAMLKAKQNGVPFDEVAYDLANFGESEGSMAPLSPMSSQPMMEAVEPPQPQAASVHPQPGDYGSSAPPFTTVPQYSMPYGPESQPETFRQTQLESLAKLTGPAAHSTAPRHPLQGKDPNTRSESPYYFSQQFPVRPTSMAGQGAQYGPPAPVYSASEPLFKPLPPETSRSRQGPYYSFQQPRSPSPSPAPSSKRPRSPSSSLAPPPSKRPLSPSSSLAPLPLVRQPRSPSPSLVQPPSRSRSLSPSPAPRSKRSPSHSPAPPSKRRLSQGRNYPEEAALQLLALKSGASSPPVHEREPDLSLPSSPGRYELDGNADDEDEEDEDEEEGDRDGEGETDHEESLGDVRTAVRVDIGVGGRSSPPVWSPSKPERDRRQRSLATPVQTPPPRPAYGRSSRMPGSPDIRVSASLVSHTSTSSFSASFVATPRPGPTHHIFRSGPMSSPAAGNFVFSSPAHPDMSKSLGLVPQEPSATFLSEFGTPRSGLAKDAFAGEHDA
jgi:hypothetical protein